MGGYKSERESGQGREGERGEKESGWERGRRRVGGRASERKGHFPRPDRKGKLELVSFITHIGWV